MAFVNKQQEVIQIQLTRLGKRLISKGNFKPQYYQFFDDDLIYDSEYAGFSEHQNSAQDRIKIAPISDVQHTVLAIEKHYNIEMDRLKPPREILQTETESQLVPARRENTLGTDAYYTELVQHNTTIEKEKLLLYPLSSINVGSPTVPRFNLSTFAKEIHNSSSVLYLTQSGISTKIPQINFEPSYRLHRDSTQQIPEEEVDTNFDFESSMIDLSKNKIEFLDGSFLEMTSEDVAIALEESSVPFLKENFDIEIFEVLEEGTDNEVHIPITDDQTLFAFFNITVDDSVPDAPKTKTVNKNFFSS